MFKRTKSQIQYIIILYNIIETIFAILFGVLSQSVALLSFGLMSMIETIGDFIIVRRLHKALKETPSSIGMTLNKPVISVAIISFLGGSWVLIQSLKVLILKTPPLRSFVGILIAICSLALMPVLTYWSYHQDSPGTTMRTGFYNLWVYILISIGLLVGLCLNYFFGFWKADPIMALVICGFLYKKSFDSIIKSGGN
jgi:divalent metal cation (Fe/Co/Zn/Cd) transporter